MPQPRFRDLVGPQPVLHSWGYTDAWLRHRPHAPAPTPLFKYLDPHGLWLPLWMAVGFVGKNGYGSATSANITNQAPIDTTGASLIVIAISDFNSVSASTASENKGNGAPTYLTATTAGTSRIRLAYWANPSVVGSDHRFSTGNAGTAYPAIGVIAFSGTDLSSPYDSSAGETSGSVGSGTTVTLGSLTPSVSDALLVTGLASNIETSATINGGFMTPGQSGGAVGGAAFHASISYLIQVGAAAAAAPTWTGSETGSGRAARMAAFKPAAGAGAVNLSALLGEPVYGASLV